MSELVWLIAVIVMFGAGLVLGSYIGWKVAIWTALRALEEAERDSEEYRKQLVTRRSTGARRAS